MQNIGFLSFDIHSDVELSSYYEEVDVCLTEQYNNSQQSTRLLERNLRLNNSILKLTYLINLATRYHFAVKILSRLEYGKVIIVENLKFTDNQGNTKTLIPYRELYKSLMLATDDGVLGKNIPNFAINISGKPFVHHVPYKLIKSGNFVYFTNDYELSFTIS